MKNTRFFTFPLTYYPAHNYKECITFMQHIAKVRTIYFSSALRLCAHGVVFVAFSFVF